MNWWGMVLVGLAVVAMVVVPLALLWVRREWLLSTRGVFDCWLRLRPATSGRTGWVFGCARYIGEHLEWFRGMSASLRPKVTINRPHVQVQAPRDPDASEREVLPPGSRVLTVTSRHGDRWELAMSEASLTGLISWLESAPPGIRYLPEE